MSQHARHQIDSEAKIKRLIKVFISLLYYACLKLYKIYKVILGQSVPGTFVVLSYHSVKEKYRNRFSKQMDALHRAGQAVPADYSGTLEQGSHYIAVTFDDGYHNIIENALPEMIKRHIPATIFLTTGYLGKIADWVVDENSHNYGERLMTAEHVRKLHEMGVSFGSHTVSHPFIDALDRATIAKEMGDSKDTLEQLLSEKITLCSLPYGTANVPSAIFKDAGYARVFLNVQKQRGNDSEDIYHGRTGVKPDDWVIEYFLKFRGAYGWLASLKRIKSNMYSIIH